MPQNKRNQQEKKKNLNQPNDRPAEDGIEQSRAWVRVEDMGLEYYNISVAKQPS